MEGFVQRINNQARADGIKVWQESSELKLKAPKGALTAELRDQFAVNKADIIDFCPNVCLVVYRH